MINRLISSRILPVLALPVESNPCTSNPCSSGTCIAEPKKCFTQPCPFYRCQEGTFYLVYIFTRVLFHKDMLQPFLLPLILNTHAIQILVSMVNVVSWNQNSAYKHHVVSSDVKRTLMHSTLLLTISMV